MTIDELGFSNPIRELKFLDQPSCILLDGRLNYRLLLVKRYHGLSYQLMREIIELMIDCFDRIEDNGQYFCWMNMKITEGASKE